MEHIFKGKWITDSEFCALKPRYVFHRELEEVDFLVMNTETAIFCSEKSFAVIRKVGTQKCILPPTTTTSFT